MQSRLRVSGHPVQPMLVAFPFGLFVCAVVFDLTDLAGGPGFLGEVGYWTAVAALVGAGLIVVAGMVDLWDVPDSRTRRTALMFQLANAVVAALFTIACLIRAGAPERAVAASLLAVELVALVVGVVGVRLGAVLVRQFDEGGAEATTFDALRTIPLSGAR